MTMVFVLSIIIGNAGGVPMYAVHSQHKTSEECVAAAHSLQGGEMRGRPLACVGVPMPIWRDV